MTAHALEDALKRVPGIEAVRVVLRGSEPSEIHVVSAPGKPAKQVVRDVQSMALATLGTSIDRRVVSVVQVEPEDLGGDRPLVVDVAETIDGSKTTVRATLSWHDQRLVGAATGPAATATRLSLAAEATLSALGEVIREDVAVAVTGTAITPIGSREVALTMVVIVADGKERSVIGSALIDNDVTRAVVRATLDAMNRQMGLLTIS